MGTRVLIVGVMPRIIFPSILEEARSMAIEHIKGQGIDVEFDLQIVFTPHFCSVVHGLNQEELAKMTTHKHTNWADYFVNHVSN